MEFPNVSTTLFTPLWGRAQAAQWHPDFRDPWATQILGQVGESFSIDGQSRRTKIVSAVRAHAFDIEARKFFEEFPSGTLVNLGAGFCTRFLRLDNGTLIGVDIDLPAVTSFKKKILNENSRWHFAAASLCDDSWLEVLRGAGLQGPYFFTAEGVLHYLNSEIVYGIFNSLASEFPGSHLVFDFYSPMVGLMRPWHPRRNRARVPLHWGLGSLDELKNLGISFEVLAERSLIRDSSPYLFFHRALKAFPFARNFYRLAHIRFI